MTTSSIRRQMKNIVNNYSEAEIKVREATSNDPWGPSSSLMTEIADLTYNVVAFSEIMSMIWRRLNDHGKNWRHVYKALTLLDYLIKTGSERVAQQCKENIFAIQTLKDFQYIDRDGKDQGINVREKSKQLVALLKDDDRLKGERAQALKTKERMAQVATGVGSNNQITFGRGSSQPNLSTSYSEQEYGKSGGSPASYHGSTSPRTSSELEQARPQTTGEEELQLQLALAMSREAAEQEERLRRGDDLRLQMAIEESRKDTTKTGKKKEPALMDLMDALPAAPKLEPWGPLTVEKKADPWGGGATAATPDPWQSYGTKPATVSGDSWGSSSSKPPDPWAASNSSVSSSKPAQNPWGSGPGNRFGKSDFDVFGVLNGTTKDEFSEFDSLRSTKPSDTMESTLLTPMASSSSKCFDSQQSGLPPSMQSTNARKTPESFLGTNASLVNLDSLVTKPMQPSTLSNPFLGSGAPVPAPINPFQINQPQPPTLNQMRASPMGSLSNQGLNMMPSAGAEPLPLSTMGIAPGMAAIVPMGRMSQGVGMSIAGSMPQPLISTGMPPTSTHTASTTNPFLL
ncbi:epsin-2 [Polypterus senegalus]|uniref:epsin-2 n=1 Tax=Polypterus senegalus TaxID=55291 RepID=UPI001964F461|nr:epsin-2 [Polypterus senegalus]XP_039631528.1 epsin-2 [Polypterus senegalus]XP_039631529.1 epsin-2 [Polypterus senegalus]